MFFHSLLAQFIEHPKTTPGRSSNNNREHSTFTEGISPPPDYCLGPSIPIYCKKTASGYNESIPAKKKKFVNKDLEGLSSGKKVINLIGEKKNYSTFFYT
ncbi:hypothetical protein CDAR_300361 [Caerostris darwini]|uniref:Uncharacterized protein n=1 Tax=Caerostris darwini TaxID=1538125 RepID=A0AAV4NS28_9ARAC|nr:hypothetical protein CDAR_300361 [Caerostris darwini]